MIRLHDLAGADPELRFSPYCWRIKMSLAHKRLPFEAVPWRFTEREAIAFSGQGLVPVIADGERVVADSWRIAEYLDETYPDRPTLLARVIGKAHANVIRHWVERSVHPIIARLVLLDVLARIDERDRAYFRESREARFKMPLERAALPPERAVAALAEVLAPARAVLAEQAYLGGAEPTFADFCLFGALMWARSVSPVEVLPEEDAVRRWREGLLDAFDGLARRAPAAA